MLVKTRFDLKAATQAAHTRLDAALSGLRLDGRDSYLAFLRVHARAAPGLERAVEAGRPWSGWSPRTPLLQADLAAMGEAMPPSTDGPFHTSDAAAWGVQYVLEGSKLGGKVLARRVGAGLPVRYLSGEGRMDDWGRFQAELQAAAAEGDQGWTARAAEAALDAFHRFETALKRELDPALGR